MYFAGPAKDSLSSKVMNDETMVSTVSPSITCPFLPPRHLSVSRVTVKQFCREERRFQYRYDRLFCEVRRPGYACIVFSRTSRRFFFLFSVEKILGIKSAKSYQNPRKGGPTIRNLKGRAWQHCFCIMPKAKARCLSLVKSRQITRLPYPGCRASWLAGGRSQCLLPGGSSVTRDESPHQRAPVDSGRHQ